MPLSNYRAWNVYLERKFILIMDMAFPAMDFVP